MATDATFELIQKIVPAQNSDNLEIAIVSNFPCVVRKNTFNVGDIAFYIRDDAKLLGFDKDRAATLPVHIIQWQEPLLKYLGSGGRVKSVKLRGNVSMGILMNPKDICPNIDNFNTLAMEFFNEHILNSETGSGYLERNFGITHWTQPSTGFGDLIVKYQGLPFGWEKTDQENYENLADVDLHLGAKCLVTKKLDGTSTTITCYPDGKYDVSSRSQTFNVEDMLAEGKENIYLKYTTEAVKAGCWWAKTHNEPIIIRGETCCGSANSSSYNADCKRNDFFVFQTCFPEKLNWFEKHGTYGTKFHFTDIVHEMNSNGFIVKTVPVIAESIVSKELLKTYNDMPWESGEGHVINIKVEDIDILHDSLVWNYKSKSREYLMKMS